MKRLTLVSKDDPILRTVAHPLEDGLVAYAFPFIIDMLDFMRRLGAIGLAAPQVGRPVRVFVMAVGTLGEAYINPVIHDYSEHTYPFDEGCLSFPGEKVQTNRARDIDVEYTDVCGTRKRELLSGLASVCFQHEMDHLNGITFHTRQADNVTA